MLDLKVLQEAENFGTHKLPACQDTHIPYVFHMRIYTFLMNTYDYSYVHMHKIENLAKMHENKPWACKI